MADQKELRYSSTGKPVFQREDKAPEVIEAEREARRQNNPRVMRAAELERIAARREREVEEQASPTKAHDSALQHFDNQFADLIADPVLRVRAHQGYHQLTRQAAMAGRQVDWQGELTKMGNGIRQSVGRMSSDQVERSETLAEMASGRAHKVK